MLGSMNTPRTPRVPRVRPSGLSAVEAVLQNDMQHVEESIDDFRGDFDEFKTEIKKTVADECAKLVTKIEFRQIQIIVLTMAGTILSTFLGAVVTFFIHRTGV